MLKFANYFCLKPWDLSGGLCLFWNENFSLDIYSWSQNVIAVDIDYLKDNIWKCKFVYGIPKFAQKRLLWRDLFERRDSEHTPQLFIGDFNDIICQDEKEGLHPKPKSQMKDFRKFIDANSLMDLELKGGISPGSATRGTTLSQKKELIEV
ncbi:hypothetical protein Ahy_B02g060864 [Arachis hypogaea]|uniref:Endonuclease/exonuclease/phosphatase domain-containing protein n=1 Tax=Arachis hypogaea TaxID=3818 RepID=A0A445AJH2_ARAHY|nr:hypothetical protein Ahy_B02g060864 [Arachis hypogaea]